MKLKVLTKAIGLIMVTSLFMTPEMQAQFKLTPTTFVKLPAWQKGQVISGFQALRKYCKAGGKNLADWKPDFRNKVCAEALTIDIQNPKAIRSFFEHYFQPYKVEANGESQGLFTGYYQPIAQASRTKKNGYETPLYKRPSDLILVEDLGEFRKDLAGFRFAGRLIGNRLAPYYTRAEIDKGALAAQGLELAWLASPVDAFFIAVQGSGLLRFEDGSHMPIGYDGANGHPYASIGKEMARLKILPEHQVSMKAIRRWFVENPGRINEILHLNPSYIFFKELEKIQPEGAHGMGLTPSGSLAVDPRFIELGSLLWLTTEEPKLNCLVMAQDVGSAIKGPIRGDFYWGTGDEAGHRAGTMATKGSYYILKPKS